MILYLEDLKTKAKLDTECFPVFIRCESSFITILHLEDVKTKAKLYAECIPVFIRRKFGMQMTIAFHKLPENFKETSIGKGFIAVNSLF